MTNNVPISIYVHTRARLIFLTIHRQYATNILSMDATNFPIFARSIPSSRSSSSLSILVDECRSDYPAERRARHIIDDRALSSAAESLILPVGIGRPLSLLGEIEIEYESTKGMQKGEKGTRIRRIRHELQDLREEKEKRGLRLMRGERIMRSERKTWI